MTAPASPTFSVLIPARNEERFLGACLDSIHAAARRIDGAVQVVVCLNRCTDRTEAIARERGATLAYDDSRNLARIRNAAARVATGQYLVTIDADSTMSPNMLATIHRKLQNPRIVGGGVLILPERWSIGIFLTGVALAPIALWHRISAGLFWCRRSDFDAIGGFDERVISAEDIDFARRLRAHGRARGQRFVTLARAHIRTSCRKFDAFGDWYFLRNPRLFVTLLRGRDQRAADGFWYEVER